MCEIVNLWRSCLLIFEVVWMNMVGVRCCIVIVAFRRFASSINTSRSSMLLVCCLLSLFCVGCSVNYL